MSKIELTMPSLLLFGFLWVFPGCGGRSMGNPQNPRDGSIDAAALGDATTRLDAVVSDRQVDPDGGDYCTCTDDQVFRRHDCIPPLEQGCGDSCDPMLDDCGEGFTCDPCAASSSCDLKDCRPACVFTGPAMGPLPEYLQISPTFGGANVSNQISITGFPFYIGALWYDVRLGDEIVTQHVTIGGVCEMLLDAPPLPAGLHPVWVSQYGGGEPWVLAGFFLASLGDLWDCVQPGFWCGPEEECCTTDLVPITCQQGRCRGQ